jgi:prepilin-type N-terminal cleavage/methylation domain-containing protein
MTGAQPIPVRPSTAGFTLIELLVSSAIIGLIMVVLLSATSASLGLWRNAEQRIAVDREGRSGMALMADDLANILPASSGALMPNFSQPGAGGVFMEFPVLRPLDYQENVNGSTNVGDVCYVRYKYVSNSIYRSHVDSKATFDALKGSPPSAPPAAAYELLADNVTELYVTPRDTNGGLTVVKTDINSVDFRVGVVDKQEMANIKNGITMPDGKTTVQYFSINVAVPKNR